MPARTFADIAQSGHPVDPQLWEPVDDMYLAARKARQYIDQALDELAELEPEPTEWVDALITVRQDIDRSLSGKREDEV